MFVSYLSVFSLLPSFVISRPKLSYHTSVGLGCPLNFTFQTACGLNELISILYFSLGSYMSIAPWSFSVIKAAKICPSFLLTFLVSTYLKWLLVLTRYSDSLNGLSLYGRNKYWIAMEFSKLANHSITFAFIVASILVNINICDRNCAKTNL